MMEQKKSTHADHMSAERLAELMERNFSSDEIVAVSPNQTQPSPQRAKALARRFTERVATLKKGAKS